MKEKKLGYWLIFLLLSVPFTFRNLFVSFGVFFNMTHRAVGVLAAILLVLVLKDRKALLDRGREVRWALISLGIFFLVTVIGQILNFQNLLYYYWGIRNNGRFFLFLFGCILFLKARERDSYMKIFDILYYINFLLTLIQFFTLDVHPDFLGGIFGVWIGNGITNVFVVIVITDSLVRFMHQKEKWWVCLLKCVMALAIAALVEIKVLFVEFALIVALVFFTSRFSWKKVYLLLGCIAVLLISIYLFKLIYPNWAFWLNPRVIWETSISPYGYTGRGDLNRLNAFSRLLNEYLMTTPQKIFGFGFGNCDLGPTDALTPAFYFNHSPGGYINFTSSYIMMETGILGSITYLAFFCVLFLGMHSLEKTGRGDPMYCQIGKILTLMCFVFYLYDCTLRTEPCFLLYFALALPFLGKEKEPA